MSGQELYEIYAREATGVIVGSFPAWHDLNAGQQRVWGNVADQIRDAVMDDLHADG